MGAFGVILRSLHCMGLYIQLSASLRQAGSDDVENHISNNAVFTEVPHDITAQSGQDVEMACSFRGAGSPSYSLEIQWWYIRNHREWTDKQTWSTNQVMPQNEKSKDATKISVVKVAGSNISHKLRLSSVKPADEGTYECRVIDFSDSKLRHHHVRAYLQVERAEGNVPPPVHQGATSQEELLQSDHHKPGRELRKRSADDSTTDCTESCAL
ncbi:V-set and transmembrane domain-containing protein 2-like protein [Carassius auratus]|uniref:V-set and transmembrane domain-containing protein 2-like protein n=1 Tax=Carassius auratus TaxID=7957 RepID=A0A6P6M8U5_CARAU|nr:V-set and transmembrane domain-containing protein 2-like protein [Carassius auratus]XP_052396236.1 V-set and transmembrane domain-containing protein 2-like protein [Carassius gibelio]